MMIITEEINFSEFCLNFEKNRRVSHLSCVVLMAFGHCTVKYDGMRFTCVN